MEHTVFSFGMVAVVVVDADTKFLHLFEDMCTALNITFRPLSRGNHKGLSIERYHQFLNKTQTIIGRDFDTHYFFLENCNTQQYT